MHVVSCAHILHYRTLGHVAQGARARGHAGGNGQRGVGPVRHEERYGEDEDEGPERRQHRLRRRPEGLQRVSREGNNNMDAVSGTSLKRPYARTSPGPGL